MTAVGEGVVRVGGHELCSVAPLPLFTRREFSPRCPYHYRGNPVCSKTEDCSPAGLPVAAEDGWTLEIALPPYINHPQRLLCGGSRTAILLPVSVSNNLTEGHS